MGTYKKTNPYFPTSKLQTSIITYLVDTCYIVCVCVHIQVNNLNFITNLALFLFYGILIA